MGSRFRAGLALSAVAIAVLVLVQCGTEINPTNPAPATVYKYFAYVLNTTLANNLHPHELDIASGAPGTAGDAVDVGTSGSSWVGLTPHPSGKFLYAANGTGFVHAFSIAATTGALTVLAGAPYALTGAHTTTVTPNGRFVYAVTSEALGRIQPYLVDLATGALSSIGGATNLGGQPREVYASPDGKFVHVSVQTSSNIETFVINPDGSLSGATSISTGMNAQPVSFVSTGSYGYAANFNAANVTRYSIDPSTGALTDLGSPAAVGAQPSSLAIDPSGRYLYVASLTAKQIAAFTIGSNGSLTPVGSVYTSPVANGPNYVRVEPNGKFLYASHWVMGAGSMMDVLGIAADGSIAPIMESPFPICGQTTAVAIAKVPQP